MFPSSISKCLCSSANLAISYKTRKNIFFNKTLTSYFYLKQSKTPNNSICRRPSYQLSKLDYRRVYYHQVRLNLLVSCNAAIKSKSFLELIIFYSEAQTFIIPILTCNQVFLGNFFSLQVLILVGSKEAELCLDFFYFINAGFAVLIVSFVCSEDLQRWIALRHQGTLFPDSPSNCPSKRKLRKR